MEDKIKKTTNANGRVASPESVFSSGTRRRNDVELTSMQRITLHQRQCDVIAILCACWVHFPPNMFSLRKSAD